MPMSPLVPDVQSNTQSCLTHELHYTLKLSCQRMDHNKTNDKKILFNTTLRLQTVASRTSFIPRATAISTVHRNCFAHNNISSQIALELFLSILLYLRLPGLSMLTVTRGCWSAELTTTVIPWFPLLRSAPALASSTLL